MIAIYINAGNSTNGNPRRGWIITNNDGEFIDFVDEDYAGTGALRTSAYPNAVSTPVIKVEPSVYKSAYTQTYGKKRR